MLTRLLCRPPDSWRPACSVLGGEEEVGLILPRGSGGVCIPARPHAVQRQRRVLYCLQLIPGRARVATSSAEKAWPIGSG